MRKSVAHGVRKLTSNFGEALALALCDVVYSSSDEVLLVRIDFDEFDRHEKVRRFLWIASADFVNILVYATTSH